MPLSIAIDGPPASGKSTLAKALAKKYGFIYVDTGALYRTVGRMYRIYACPAKIRKASSRPCGDTY